MHTFEIIDGYIHDGTVNDYMSVSYEDGTSVASLSYKDYEVHYVLDHYWNNRFVLHLRHKETDGRWTEVTLKQQYTQSPHPHELEYILYSALRDNIDVELAYGVKILGARVEQSLSLVKKREENILKGVIMAIIEETNDQIEFEISHSFIGEFFNLYIYHQRIPTVRRILALSLPGLNKKINDILNSSID